VSEATTGVRITLAAPEADLLASVWPGVSVIYCPRVESASQLRAVDVTVSELERRRGIRPGTIELRPLIESPAGVANADEIAGSSRRIHVFGLGPAVELQLSGDALAYARSECALRAHAHGLIAQDTGYLLD
jgi:citrate lyase subunit beta/citryl-CoA lyase